MILLHHPEVELSRKLLAELPVDCTCVDWSDEIQRIEYRTNAGPEPSAFPTVVVDVPVYFEERQYFNEDGEFLGMASQIVPAHLEAIRMPASWNAVQQFVDFCATRTAK